MSNERKVHAVPKPVSTKKGKGKGTKKPSKTVNEAAVDDKVRQRNNTNRNFGKAVEREVAKRTGGHRVPASGSIKNSVWNLEGDVRIQSEDGKATLVLIECKGQSAMRPSGDVSFTMKWSTLKQAGEEARLVGAIPVVYLHPKGNDYEDDFVIIPSREFYNVVVPALQYQYNLSIQEQDE